MAQMSKQQWLDSELDYMLWCFILEVWNEAGERYKSYNLKKMIVMIQHFYNKNWIKDGQYVKTGACQSTRNSLYTCI